MPTPIEESMLGTLRRRVRAMSVVQVAHTWWRDSMSPMHNASRMVDSLAAQGLVELYTTLTYPGLQESPGFDAC